jgi:polyhydroxyalkanoate synthesis regulator phasin
MDELVKELVAKAGLNEEQAKAAVDVFLAYIKHDENRKKVIQAAMAATIASAVAVRAI